MTLSRNGGFGRRRTEAADASRSEREAGAEPAPAKRPLRIVRAEGQDDPGARLRPSLMERIDPLAAATMPRAELRAELDALVGEIAAEQRLALTEREQRQLAADLFDDMIGLGPLEPLMEDESITDILVNGPERIYVERGGKLERIATRFRDNAHVVHVAQRIAAGVGRRVDEASPMVDARLPDGSRVNIVLPPLTLDGATIAIRKFARREITLADMARTGNLSEPLARALEILAAARLNVLISGGTGSGKTTLLNAMSRVISPDERIITIEDAAELQLQQPHVVRMETRPANVEGQGQVTQRDLVRNALRMRPDRIIIGEVRGGEAFDMLQAMNTGHDGSLSTIHASSARDALARLENMVLAGTVSLPLRAIRTQIVSAVHVIVQIERMRDGVRRVQQVTEVLGLESDVITTQDLFAFVYDRDKAGRILGRFEPARLRPRFLERAAYHGLDRDLKRALGIEA
jgi:pilus assembly protein CpaF